MTGPFIWSFWIDMTVGIAGSAVVVPTVFYLVQWHDAQALRSTGLTRRETLWALFYRFQTDLLRWLKRLERDAQKSGATQTQPPQRH